MDYTGMIAKLNMEKTNRYFINTFGCQQNEHDSEKIAGMLEEMGYVPAEDIEDSDVIVYNTCCVRESAEQKVFGHLGRLKKIREKRPGTVMVLCGCMVQQEHIVDEIKEKYRHVDVIMGTRKMHRFPELLYNAMIERQRTVDTGMEEGNIKEGIPVSRQDGLKAWVTITTGCNNFCSYCIVPYVRGRECSRAEKNILDEIKQLSRNGYREITLLGQNVNSYGRDRGNGSGFASLLYKVNIIDGIERIRFMTSHPRDFSTELADAMKECEKVCEHLHLPVQSGSNNILERMNRGYTREEYLEKIEMVREKIPDIAITTDIIVGFPGETDKDFEDTLDIIRKVRYDSAYTFIYSDRKGTPAEGFSGKISSDNAKKRFEKLLELQNSISLEINMKYEEKVVEVLVEGPSKNNSSVLTGRTGTNKIVNFSGGRELVGRLEPVRITKARTWSLEGAVNK